MGGGRMRGRLRPVEVGGSTPSSAIEVGGRRLTPVLEALLLVASADRTGPLAPLPGGGGPPTDPGAFWIPMVLRYRW